MRTLKIFHLRYISLVALLLLAAGCGGGGSGGSSPSANIDAVTSSSSSSSSSNSSSSSSSSVTDAQQLTAVTITTTGGAAITSKDDYVTGTVSIAATADTAAFTDTMSIKLHGNSTIGFPKLPYKIKLDDKSSVLGLPKQKNWILLANYADKSLLRNRVALHIAQNVSPNWTPHAIPVEVTLNGVYEGVYDLVEQPEVDKNRVNIPEIDDTYTGDPAQGGYLLEVNSRLDDGDCWSTDLGVPVCLEDPDPSTSDEQTYIKTYIQTAENVLYSNDPTNTATGYETYIDVDSLIDWYLVNELFKNVDSAFGNSVYFYKGPSTRLTFGPVWDFDTGAGNANYVDSTPEGFWTAQAIWIQRMEAVDPTFKTRVRARWDAIKASQIDTLPAYIDEQAAALQGAQARNFARWPILGTYVWPNAYVGNTYADEVTYLKNWLTQRAAWMDANL